MDQLKCASLSHTHYWYDVSMLKVPAAYSSASKPEYKSPNLVYANTVYTGFRG